MERILKNFAAIRQLLQDTELIIEAMREEEALLHADGLTLEEILPEELQGGNIDLTPLKRAIKKGMVRVRANGLEWMGGNKVLLVYLLGRIWAGDRSVFEAKYKRTTWKSGRQNFPEAALSRLFKVSNLRAIRNQRLTCCVPIGYGAIDKLF